MPRPDTDSNARRDPRLPIMQLPSKSRRSFTQATGRTARACWRFVARPRRAGAAGIQGAALRVPHRRNRLRSGADPGPVFEHAWLRTSSRRRSSSTISRGRRSCGPNTAAAMPEVDGRLPPLGRATPARHLLRGGSGLQRQAARAASPPTTSTRSSATTTRAGRVRASTCWKTPRSSACPSCGRKR